MNQFQNSISKVEIQDFILSHENDDVQKLLLKQKTVLGMPTEWIAQQITGRRKAKNKLPAYATDNPKGSSVWPYIWHLHTPWNPHGY